MPCDRYDPPEEISAAAQQRQAAALETVAKELSEIRRLLEAEHRRREHPLRD